MIEYQDKILNELLLIASDPEHKIDADSDLGREYSAYIFEGGENVFKSFYRKKLHELNDQKQKQLVKFASKKLSLGDMSLLICNSIVDSFIQYLCLQEFIHETGEDGARGYLDNINVIDELFNLKKRKKFRLDALVETLKKASIHEPPVTLFINNESYWSLDTCVFRNGLRNEAEGVNTDEVMLYNDFFNANERNSILSATVNYELLKQLITFQALIYIKKHNLNYDNAIDYINTIKMNEIGLCHNPQKLKSIHVNETWYEKHKKTMATEIRNILYYQLVPRLFLKMIVFGRVTGSSYKDKKCDMFINNWKNMINNESDLRTAFELCAYAEKKIRKKLLFQTADRKDFTKIQKIDELKEFLEIRILMN